MDQLGTAGWVTGGRERVSGCSRTPSPFPRAGPGGQPARHPPHVPYFSLSLPQPRWQDLEASQTGICPMCPICKKSLGDYSRYWRTIDQQVGWAVGRLWDFSRVWRTIDQQVGVCVCVLGLGGWGWLLDYSRYWRTIDQQMGSGAGGGGLWSRWIVCAMWGGLVWAVWVGGWGWGLRLCLAPGVCPGQRLLRPRLRCRALPAQQEAAPHPYAYQGTGQPAKRRPEKKGPLSCFPFLSQIARSPVPHEYHGWRADILCNDCS